MSLPKALGVETSSGDVRTRCDGWVASITLSNPGKLNALNAQMWNKLKDAFAVLSRRTDLRCIVIAGEGRDAFAAGADISEFDSVRSTPTQVERYHEETVLGAIHAIAGCDIPVVAAIRGACIGGGLEIASVCDIRLCNDTARFGAPVGLLGFPMAPYELKYLLQYVSSAVVAELLLQGKIFKADEAYNKGLVSQIAIDSEFDKTLKGVVDGICKGSPLAARTNKQQLRAFARLNDFPSLAERRAFYTFAQSDDYRIGREAFIRKEAPVFNGT